jgi:hypothetical protein
MSLILSFLVFFYKSENRRRPEQVLAQAGGTGVLGGGIGG